jgi:Nif-specific regulatory protein
LLESELFGHEKGAFTGAVTQKKGKLEVADGGSVFLDEVGEVAPSIQAKLLRVLQSRQFERVGGTHPIRVDIRVIAATNRNLEEAIRNGTFRQELYYRLNVASITVPPLRERHEDIPLLAAYFATRACKRAKRRIMGTSPQARSLLMGYDWPGNVRELENAIERAVVLGSSDMIQPEDLPEAILETDLPAGTPLAGYHASINALKRELIVKAVRQAGGNYTEAAKLLGLHPNHLHRIIRNMGLKPALTKQS